MPGRSARTSPTAASVNAVEIAASYKIAPIADRTGSTQMTALFAVRALLALERLELDIEAAAHAELDHGPVVSVDERPLP